MDENMNGNQQNGMNAGQPDGAAQNMNPNQQAYHQVCVHKIISYKHQIQNR